jgi:hypothetical protein
VGEPLRPLPHRVMSVILPELIAEFIDGPLNGLLEVEPI